VVLQEENISAETARTVRMMADFFKISVDLLS
jgi:hypothetical protein